MPPDTSTARRRPLVAHLTTTDISLSLLLGPQLQAFRNSGYDIIGISAPGPFVSDLEEAGIPHVPLTRSTRSRSLRSDVAAAWELAHILKRLKPQILHTHNPKPGIYGRIVGRATHVPAVVNTVHGLYAAPDDPLLRRAVVYSLERLASTCSDAELVQNSEDLEVLARLRVPEKKLHLLGNGIDLDRFRPPAPEDRKRARRNLGYDANNVVVGAVGRLVWEKGYAEFFSAFESVRASNSNVEFVVAGPADPGKKDAVPSEAISSAEASGVRFLGHRSAIEEVYAALDIYVLASHREGFPRSAMEAAAMGIPIVATNIRGSRQVVDDGTTGLLVPPRDSLALADAIRELVNNLESRLTMGERGHTKALREFDQRHVIDVTLAIYDRLLKQY